MREHEPFGLRARLVRRLRRQALPVRAIDEEALFERVVRDAVSEQRLRGPAHRESMRALALERGPDYAAAWYYLTLLKTPRPVRTPAQPPKRVLIVPGAFYETLPEYNTDGEMGIEAARRWGLPVERAPLPEFAPIEKNALLLREILGSQPDDRSLIVSISKGSSDLLVALHRYPELRAKISSWISIGGLPRGTFQCDYLLDSTGLARWLLPAIAWLHGGSLATLRSMRAGKGSLLDGLDSRPALEVPITSIVPVPLRSHMTPFLRERFDRLQAQGPNDGMSLLADSVIPGSRAIPVWGADHFFLVPGFSKYLLQALREQLGETQLTRFRDSSLSALT